MTGSSEKIEEALAALREAMSRVVREEQLRDQLTGLGNDQALTEWIKTQIDQQKPFWIAFLEVDRFKEINDAFGYTNADTLLQKIAEQLTLASSFFPNGVVPFRAHGDEFFLAGPLLAGDEDEVASALDHVKATIGRMKVRVLQVERLMQCTVSVGWTTSRDEAKGGQRGLRHNLELATSAAKHRGRDRVVRYGDDLLKSEVVSVRGDCGKCGSSFAASIPRGALAAEPTLYCPNCGASRPRPPIVPPAAAQAEQDI